MNDFARVLVQVSLNTQVSRSDASRCIQSVFCVVVKTLHPVSTYCQADAGYVNAHSGGKEGSYSSLQTVSSALAAGAHSVGSGKDTHLRLRGIPDLGQRIDHTTDESDKDCRDTRKRNWGVEEDETRNGQGEFVECPNHGVGG